MQALSPTEHLALRAGYLLGFAEALRTAPAPGRTNPPLPPGGTTPTPAPCPEAAGSGLELAQQVFTRALLVLHGCRACGGASAGQQSFGNDARFLGQPVGSTQSPRDRSHAVTLSVHPRPGAHRLRTATGRTTTQGTSAALRPGGLTPREGEVLELLVAGLSNREIAAALVVSVRTVGRHIDNLYGKLGVRGRASARQYAHDHGLLTSGRHHTAPDPLSGPGAGTPCSHARG